MHGADTKLPFIRLALVSEVIYPSQLPSINRKPSSFIYVFSPFAVGQKPPNFLESLV